MALVCHVDGDLQRNKLGRMHFISVRVNVNKSGEVQNKIPSRRIVSNFNSFCVFNLRVSIAQNANA